jgi:hypothetical protein
MVKVLHSSAGARARRRRRGPALACCPPVEDSIARAVGDSEPGPHCRPQRERTRRCRVSLGPARRYLYIQRDGPMVTSRECICPFALRAARVKSKFNFEFYHHADSLRRMDAENLNAVAEARLDTSYV